MTKAKFEYSLLIGQDSNRRSLMLLTSQVRSALCTLMRYWNALSWLVSSELQNKTFSARWLFNITYFIIKFLLWFSWKSHMSCRQNSSLACYKLMAKHSRLSVCYQFCQHLNEDFSHENFFRTHQYQISKYYWF